MRALQEVPSTGATLCFIGDGGSENVRGTVFPTTSLMESRSGLIVQGDLTRVDGNVERRSTLPTAAPRNRAER